MQIVEMRGRDVPIAEVIAAIKKEHGVCPSESTIYYTVKQAARKSGGKKAARKGKSGVAVTVVKAVAPAEAPRGFVKMDLVAGDESLDAQFDGTIKEICRLRDAFSAGLKALRLIALRTRGNLLQKAETVIGEAEAAEEGAEATGSDD